MHFEEYIQDPSHSPYGSIINCWYDVSKLTFVFSNVIDIDELIYEDALDSIFKDFNEDLDCWNTSNVTFVQGMFAQPSSFTVNSITV